uniref:hypothetical protein n=2 Tax=Mesorhizobium zhangyense TaxID=1776730 RepID=UPI001FEA4554|nr:hypothetical protein [Mesorhizobium zhangyense]
MLFNKLVTLSGFAALALFMASPASALTMKECSAKYNAAKDAGSLSGQTWNQFRKAECAADDSAATAPAKADTKKAAKTTKKASDTAASDDEAKGLSMKECSAKYNAAKDADALNGMKWNDFRKAQCGPGASTTVAAKPAKASKSSDTAAAGDEAKGLSMKECSAKYNAAKDGDALNGMKWNDFRKAECGPGASATMAAKPAAASDDEAKGLSMQECSTKYNAAKDANALNGMKWNDFRKAQCGPGASATMAAKPAKASKSDTAAADTGGKGLTMKECSAKYSAAKDANSLGGQSWNQFRKSSCSASAADDDSVPNLDQATYDGEPDQPTVTAPRGVSFPKAVSKKFATETPGKARMHTCLEQYYDNKDSDSLAGLRWIQKGGGYYSLCNARLKASVSG